MIDDTCRIYRDIDKHPLPLDPCRIDVRLECGSELIGCFYEHGVVHFKCVDLALIGDIKQWRYTKRLLQTRG